MSLSIWPSATFTALTTVVDVRVMGPVYSREAELGALPSRV